MNNFFASVYNFLNLLSYKYKKLLQIKNFFSLQPWKNINLGIELFYIQVSSTSVNTVDPHTNNWAEVASILISWVGCLLVKK